MTTATGRIALKGVNGELRQVLGAQVSMNDSSVRTLAGVPSGQISMSQLQGKTVGSTAFIVISGTSTGSEAWNWSSGFGSKFSAPTGTAGGYTVANQASSDSEIELLGDVVFRGTQDIPYVWARKFTSAGWGTLYSTNSALLLSNDPNTLAVHPNGDYVAVCEDVNYSFLRVIDFWSETAYGTNGTLFAGWGANYMAPFTYNSNTTTFPGSTAPFQMRWSRGGRAIAVGHITTPFITVFPFDGVITPLSNTSFYAQGDGFGTKYSNPGTLPNGTVFRLTFSDSAIITSSRVNENKYLEAWAWSDSSGFGTKFSNPATDFTAAKGGLGVNIELSPNQAYIAVGGRWSSTHSTTKSNCLFLYAWNNSTGFGTLYSNPTNSLTSNNAVSGTTGVSWSNDSASVAFTSRKNDATTSTVGVDAWAISSGWGTKYAAPATVPVASTVFCPDFK